MTDTKNPSSNNTTSSTTHKKKKSSGWLSNGLFRRRQDDSEQPPPQQQDKTTGLAVRAYVASHNNNSVNDLQRGSSNNSPSATAANLTKETSSNSTGKKWNTVVKANQSKKLGTLATTTTTTSQEPKSKTTTSKVTTTGGNFLTRTKFFQEMLKWAFDQVDADGSGTVDEKELYSGLLLIHLKLGTYAGPAACKPISREQTRTLFETVDVDHSGTLDRTEFDAVMMILFGNALLRVAFQYAATLLLVPLLAQQLLSTLMWIVSRMGTILLNTLDPTTTTTDTTTGTGQEGESIVDVWDILWDRMSPWMTMLRNRWMETSSSSLLFLEDMTTTLHKYLQHIPASVWNSMPLTLISTILSMMLIPWTLMKIDDFFQNLADQKKAKKEKEI